MKKYREQILIIFSFLFILFWLFAAGTQLYDFKGFKGEMNNQVFSGRISTGLAYVIPITEIVIAGLLVYTSTRLAGMMLSLLLALTFTIYVGLALLEVYYRIPCNCAGLLGGDGTWEANFMLNLFVTVVALAGFIITFKNRERRDKSIDAASPALLKVE